MLLAESQLQLYVYIYIYIYIFWNMSMEVKRRVGVGASNICAVCMSLPAAVPATSHERGDQCRPVEGKN